MSEMIPVQLDHYSAVGDDWLVDEHGFKSPRPQGRPAQILVFADRLRNGSISADITVLDCDDAGSGDPHYEAGLVVRYGGRDSYAFAGVGGFGFKFSIGKASPGPQYVPRSYVGQYKSVSKNGKYKLRVDFSGSQIALFENDVQQLVVVDDTYQIGQLALRTWQTTAQFANVHALKVRPRAFLLMPFKSEFDFVHKVIQDSMASFDLDCVRADQIAISRPVMDDVKTQIAEADLVVVDFTGQNSNVYYEAGLADAMRKDWIILAQSTNDLTFDVRHIRSILYSNVMGADRKLRTDLENALSALGYGEGSLASKPSGTPGAPTPAER
jgi:hypothetical protein